MAFKGQCDIRCGRKVVVFKFKKAKTFLAADVRSFDPDQGILCSSLADSPIMRSCTVSKEDGCLQTTGIRTSSDRRGIPQV